MLFAVSSPSGVVIPAHKPRFASGSMNWYSNPTAVKQALNTETHKAGNDTEFTLGDLFSLMVEQAAAQEPATKGTRGITFLQLLQGRLKFSESDALKITNQLIRFQLLMNDFEEPSRCTITQAGQAAYQSWMTEHNYLDLRAWETNSAWMQQIGGVKAPDAAERPRPTEPVTVAAVPVSTSSTALILRPSEKIQVDGRLEPYAGFVTDMSYEVAQGKHGDVVGRDEDIQKLTRAMEGLYSKKVIVHGPVKSGKTSVIRGFAKANPDLKVWTADLGGIIAGTKLRGELEEKVRNFMNFVKTQPDVVVHVTEGDTLIQAGDSEGGLTIGKLLKPYLEDPSMRMILEMADSAYRQTFSKNESLNSDFKVLSVKDPDQDLILTILNSFREPLEKHYTTRISDEVLQYLVRMTREHVRNQALMPVMRQLLDTAGSLARKKVMTTEHVAAALQEITGVPLVRLTESDKDNLLRLEQKLSDRVVGHDDAKKKLAKAIRRRRSGLFPAKGPIGVFMLDGPTGVGKTELAKALAEWMSGKEGSDENLIRVNFNEYGEGINGTRIGGAPPGYVGYSQGGELTEQIYRKPNSVILLDEIEKADEATRNKLLTLIDEGVMVDGQGRTIDARNCIIIMTTNAGARDRERFDQDSETKGDFGLIQKSNEEKRTQRTAIMEEALQEHFSPEFRSRIDEILILDDLSRSEQAAVIDLHLNKLLKVLASQNFKVEVDSDVRKFLLEQQFATGEGSSKRKAGRKVNGLLKEYLETPLAEFKIENDLHKGARLDVRMNETRNGVVVSQKPGFDRAA